LLVQQINQPTPLPTSPAGHQGRRWSSRSSLVIKVVTGHQGHCWSSRSSLVIKGIAGHQDRRWSSRSSLVIKSATGSQGRCWSSRSSPVIKGVAGRQGRRWSSRASLVVKVVTDHQGHCWSSGALLALPYLAGRAGAYLRRVKIPMYAELEFLLNSHGDRKYYVKGPRFERLARYPVSSQTGSRKGHPGTLQNRQTRAGGDHQLHYALLASSI